MISIKNSVLMVEGAHRITDLEEAIEKLEESGAALDLLVNTKRLSHAQFGGVAAMFQLMITWARRNPQGRLRTYVTNSSDELREIHNLSLTDHGLLGVLLSHDVTDRAGVRSLRAECMGYAVRRLAAMDTVVGATRGAKVFVVAADHTTFAAPGTLYAKTDVDSPPLRSWGSYEDLGRDVMQRLRQGPGAMLPGNETLRRLATVLRELIQNTHDWARHDTSGRRLSPSIRGVRAELYSHPTETHQAMVSDVPMIQEYIANERLRREDNRQRLVEITIFDSGPGLAARRLAQLCSEQNVRLSAAPIDLEHSAIVDCLRKHFTTGKPSHRGDGLHQVMTMLNELNGFMRLRTGRLALARDFMSHPYRPNEDESEPFLLDWSSRGRQLTQHSRCEGTVLTMIFPVRYDD